MLRPVCIFFLSLIVAKNNTDSFEDTRYTHSPSSRLIVQPLPQQPSTGHSKFHTNALRLKGCDEATVVMRRDECRMPRTETEMQNDRFQPASTHERWVKCKFFNNLAPIVLYVHLICRFRAGLYSCDTPNVSFRLRDISGNWAIQLYSSLS